MINNPEPKPNSLILIQFLQLISGLGTIPSKYNLKFSGQFHLMDSSDLSKFFKGIV
jgi:hypothetical protein